MKAFPRDITRVILLSSAVHELRNSIAQGPREYEQCGFLFGEESNGQAVIKTASAAENIYFARDKFAIGDREYSRALHRECVGQRLLGIYHTHLGRAVMSGQDERNAALHRFLWLLIGIFDSPHLAWEWKCFKPALRAIEEVSLEIGA
ncbi:MAG TPA: Mov34/MPN/PAD-1 family protein [Terriglobales bacterium]|nr:Mov34/MPN/PAD-1 family protein [Terriglobales bacterium]